MDKPSLPDNVKDLYPRMSVRDIAPLAPPETLAAIAARLIALGTEPQEALAGGGDAPAGEDRFNAKPSAGGPDSPLRRRDERGRPLPGSMTDRARRCLGLARACAATLGHRTLSTGHLLVGIAHEGSGIGGHVLTDAGLRVEALNGYVAAAPGAFKALTSAEVVYETPALTEVLVRAGHEALRLEHNHVGTEHLLISLLSGATSYATRLCELCCVNNHLVVENTLLLCAPDLASLVNEKALWTHPLQIVEAAVATLRAYLDVGGHARMCDPVAEGALRAITKAAGDFRQAMRGPGVLSASDEGAILMAAEELDERVGDAKFATLIDAVYYLDLGGKPVAWNGKVVDRENVHLWRQVLQGQFDSLARAADAEGWGFEKLRHQRAEAEPPTSPHDVG